MLKISISSVPSLAELIKSNKVILQYWAKNTNILLSFKFGILLVTYFTAILELLPTCCRPSSGFLLSFSPFQTFIPFDIVFSSFLPSTIYSYPRQSNMSAADKRFMLFLYQAFALIYFCLVRLVYFSHYFQGLGPFYVVTN